MATLVYYCWRPGWTLPAARSDIGGFVMPTFNTEIIPCKYWNVITIIWWQVIVATGTSVVPITLCQGQDLDSKVWGHVTGSGPVYIRALVK